MVLSPSFPVIVRTSRLSHHPAYYGEEYCLLQAFLLSDPVSLRIGPLRGFVINEVLIERRHKSARPFDMSSAHSERLVRHSNLLD